jgi:uridine phosphorylase
MVCVSHFSDDTARPDVRKTGQPLASWTCRSRPCVRICTAGGFQASQEPGDVVLLTSAVRDEGTSYHYLPAGSPAIHDEALTSRFAGALDAAGIACTAGATVTTDAPYRTTAEEIRVHRASGTCVLEIEAAALFAATIGWLAAGTADAADQSAG